MILLYYAYNDRSSCLVHNKSVVVSVFQSDIWEAIITNHNFRETVPMYLPLTLTQILLRQSQS